MTIFNVFKKPCKVCGSNPFEKNVTMRDYISAYSYIGEKMFGSNENSKKEHDELVALLQPHEDETLTEAIRRAVQEREMFRMVVKIQDDILRGKCITHEEAKEHLAKYRARRDPE